MIFLKKEIEIEKMRRGGQILGQILQKTISLVKPGVTTLELDRFVEMEILKNKGKPSFKMVPKYFWSSCITINNEVVHGIPGSKKIKAGDVVSIDIGMYYQGFHTDTSWTVLVPNGDKEENKEKQKFLRVGEEALIAAIKKAAPGSYLGDISQEIQSHIERAGYHVVRELTGHGVGKFLHEDPSIPGFLNRKIEKTGQIKEGMTLAIEVIYTLGQPEILLEADGWTIATKDGKISALFEGTVAVLSNGPLILTKLI